MAKISETSVGDFKQTMRETRETMMPIVDLSIEIVCKAYTTYFMD